MHTSCFLSSAPRKKKIFQNNHNSMYVLMTKIRHAILCVKPFMKKNQTSTGKYNGFVIKCCDTNGDLKRRILVQVHLERKFQARKVIRISEPDHQAGVRFLHNIYIQGVYDRQLKKYSQKYATRSIKFSKQVNHITSIPYQNALI